jgi:DNA-binding IclR family transcriptional regulator
MIKSNTSTSRVQIDVDADAGFATTLAKGLSVLEAFAPGETLLGNSELAARTGLSRPTVARLASTLAELGYLAYDGNRAKYRLAIRALRIARPLLADMKVRQIARPLMQELAMSVHGTVSLGVIDGTSVIYVESARSGDVGSHLPDIGCDLPIARAAIGRALASLLSSGEQFELGQRIQHETPDIWKTYGERYAAGIAQCGEQGYCVSRGDWQPTIHAAAVPLFRSSETGECVGLNCGVPAFRLRHGEIETEIVPRLMALAASIRALMPDA